MAGKITLSEDNQYGSGNLDIAAAAHRNNWTDGLPHDFKGWGPRTPDPEDHDSQVAAPQNELTWRGGEDDDHRNHYVWHFDGRRQRHH